MNKVTVVLLLATILTAAGLWWALPWGGRRYRTPGWVFAAGGLALLATLLPPVGGALAQVLATAMGVIAVGSAIAMVTSARPVYAALWFAMSVLGTAGMFLYHGAEFLSIAVIVIYIGAILVAFLFLVMLDDPKGEAPFNRQSWSPFWAALAGTAVIVFCTAAWLQPQGVLAEVAEQGQLSGQVTSGVKIVTTSDLGRELFSRYAVGTITLGVMLLLALVGAAVIIARPLEPLVDLAASSGVEEPPICDGAPSSNPQAANPELPNSELSNPKLSGAESSNSESSDSESSNSEQSSSSASSDPESSSDSKPGA